MNRKTIGALLLSAALLVGGTASTFAYFTSSTSSEVVSFTTGNVKIAFDKDRETAWQLVTQDESNLVNQTTVSQDGKSITNVAPGDKLKKSFKLKNTGSLDAKVRLSLVSESGALLPNADGSNVEWRAYMVGDNGTQVPVQLQYVTDDENNSYAVLPAHSDENLNIEAIVEIDEALGNEYADKTFKFIVKAEATQLNNPGWTQAGN